MLTIMIPTKNRANFLIRLLKYFASIGCKYRISIGDSSDIDDQKKIKEAVLKLKSELDIDYHELPGQNVWQSYKKLVDSLTTPYAVYMPDDDFLVPSGLQSCIDFLEQNSDYCGAHGESILFAINEHGPYGTFAGVANYKLSQVDGHTAAMRLTNFIKNYSVIFFSVFRSSAYRLFYDETQISYSDRAFKEELLPCCLAVVLGKIKHLDDFYLVRQTHVERYVMPPWFVWLTSPEWNSSYRIFCDILSRKISQSDGISVSAAEIIVKEAFCQYLAKTIGKRPKMLHSETLIRKFGILMFAKKLLFAKQYIEGAFTDKISLPAFFNPRFKFHRDFLPIYRVVAKSNHEEINK